MEKRKGFSGAGLSTILLIFVMLCLIVFATLSLSTAWTDLKMSRNIADRTTAYYEAQSKAYKKVKEIDEILTAEYNEKKQKFADDVWTALQSDNDLFVTRDENKILCSFEQPIDETQKMRIELTIKYSAENEKADCQITGWKNIQSEEWKADTDLPVLKKEEQK